MTSQRRIVYPDAEDTVSGLFTGARLARLEALGDFRIAYGRPTEPEDLLARMGDAHAVLLGWGLPVEALRGAANLEVVSFIGMGVGNFVDLGEASRLGITVCRTDSAAEAVAEHTLALMLNAARHIARLDRDLRAGAWNVSLPGMDLRGKTLGLVGFGRIAQATTPLALAFGMRVLAWTRTPSPARAAEHGVEYAELDRVLAEADVLALMLPVTAETEGLLSAQRLRRTKPGVVLVNTARAELVDEEAMLDLLRSGHIAAAGIDVFPQEPLPPGHPLTELDNVVLTPHTAYNTPEAAEAMIDMAISNIEAFYAGTPTNVANG
jgi:D-3-phosphoglycerate dehydrogenase